MAGKAIVFNLLSFASFREFLGKKTGFVLDVINSKRCVREHLGFGVHWRGKKGSEANTTQITYMQVTHELNYDRHAFWCCPAFGCS
jgi:hypothetical protein